MTSVFLGLVTHEGTHFPLAAGPNGLVAQVAAALTAHGWRAQVQINSDDAFDESHVSLTQQQVLDSIRSELQLERRWRDYLDAQDAGWQRSIEFACRYLYRRMRFAPFGARRASVTKRGSQMLRRLVNIELSHLELLRSAQRSGCSWALIVEDDATVEDAIEFAADLQLFLEKYSHEATPSFLNVSDSFDYSALKVGDHLHPRGTWNSRSEILSADRPVTNTVCAVLYHADFLSKLLPVLSQIPISPVIPIDWKINAALLDLYSRGQIGADDCWLVSPGPIMQGSMQGSNAGELK